MPAEVPTLAATATATAPARAEIVARLRLGGDGRSIYRSEQSPFRANIIICTKLLSAAMAGTAAMARTAGKATIAEDRVVQEEAEEQSKPPAFDELELNATRLIGSELVEASGRARRVHV